MINQKNILDSIISGVVKVLNLTPLKNSLNNYTEKQYHSGLAKADAQYGKATGVNFVPEKNRLQLLQDTMQDNIDNQGLEVSNSVKGELQRWKLSNESIPQAKQRIREAMKKKKWNYKMKRIVRTEGMRAGNAGSYDGAKQAQDAGLQIVKWLDVTLDTRTTECCKAGYSKYGDESKAIPLDQEFVIKTGNKTYRAQFPPFMPNCRTVLRTKKI